MDTEDKIPPHLPLQRGGEATLREDSLQELALWGYLVPAGQAGKGVRGEDSLVI